MADWLKQTKKRIDNLRKEGFFDNWKKEKLDLIAFHIFPELIVEDSWKEGRLSVYKTNAKKLKIIPPHINFYIYPSIEEGKKLGITPAIAFIKEKEIHGHLNQSSGHEPVHILLGELNSSENLPANGLWAEGIATFLDETNTDYKKFTLSLNYSNKILNTSWKNWQKNLPGELYPLAGSIVKFCFENFGWDKLLNFIKDLKDYGSNEEKSSLKNFNINYQDLQKNWIVWLKK